MKTSTALRRAGDVLRARGWHQGGFCERQTVSGSTHDPGGAVCPWGAVNVATVGYPSNCSVNSDAVLLLNSAAGGYIAHWNDDVAKTAAEVLVVVDAAYVLALQAEGVEPGDVL